MTFTQHALSSGEFTVIFLCMAIIVAIPLVGLLLDYLGQEPEQRYPLD